MIYNESFSRQLQNYVVTADSIYEKRMDPVPLHISV
jgi:hypothetical protein